MLGLPGMQGLLGMLGLPGMLGWSMGSGMGKGVTYPAAATRAPPCRSSAQEPGRILGFPERAASSLLLSAHFAELFG